MEKVKNLVVGCGLSGIVIAERLAEEKKEKVLIIAKRKHIGGNIFDYKDRETGIMVHKYGPHVFHTNEKKVWDYLSRFTQWHPFMYKVKALIDGIEVNIPFNLDSLHKVFPKHMAEKFENKLIEKFGFNKKVPILDLKTSGDVDLQFLAQYVYEKVFLGYTLKQWGVKPENLDSSVSARVPVFISRDSRYFQDKYQAIPAEGYTQMAANMLKNPLIEVRLGNDYKDIRNKIEYEKLFYSGAIDEFFDFEFGALPYRSLDIMLKTFNKTFVQSGPQINYPENYDYTRSVEYKYYLDEISDKTVVSYEFPCSFKIGKNERYYPIPAKDNEVIYQAYKQKALTLNNVFFLGRLGDYKYYNMDQVVSRALDVFKGVADA